jgi:hypothetical protein
VLHRHKSTKIEQSQDRALVAAIVLALAVPVCWAENQALNVPPAELVRRAVQTETAANTGPGVHFMFKDRRQTTHLTQTKLIVETSDATAGMVIEQDGHPHSAPAGRRGAPGKLCSQSEGSIGNANRKRGTQSERNGY